MTPKPSRSGPFARPTNRVLLRFVGAAVLLIMLIFTYQAIRAGLALRQAQADAHSLKKQVSEGDQRGALRSLRRVADQSRTARSHTDNILWRGAARMPWLGRNIGAVQVIARVLDDASHSAQSPTRDLLVTLTETDLRSEDGRFDLASISRLAPDFDRLEAASATAAAGLDAVDATALVDPLGRATAKLQEQVATLHSTARAGATATRILPSFLGVQSPRTYLLVIQNNAEIRATGGLPGAFSILRASDGKVSLDAQRSAMDFPVLSSPVLPLSPGERALYGDNLAEDVRDTNLTPDFPRSAALMVALLGREHQQRVDGVISVDPVALSAVLGATGPIKVGRETFTRDNVVDQLLSRPYQRFDNPDEQDDYFARAARGIFDALLSGTVEQMSAVRELAGVAGQRRLLVWSSHADEQRRIRGFAVAGELPADTGDVPHVGMYLNDATAGKMQYYLDYSGSLRSVDCSRTGVQTLDGDIILTSSVPHDLSGLPPYVTGVGNYAPKGAIRMNLRIYAPTGGSVSRLETNGQPLEINPVEHDGHQVVLVTLQIDPGEEVRLSARVKTRAGQRGDPVLQWTPGVRTSTSGETARSSCR